MSDTSILHCLFCGKSQNEVKQLIAGAKPEARICNECIGACVDILRAQGLAAACDRCADLELEMDLLAAT